MKQQDIWRYDMSMYTEIYVNVDLKEETPVKIIEILRAMCDFNVNVECLIPYPHRWKYLFGSGSYYTPNTYCRKLTYDDTSKQYSLLAKGDIKNYNNEIEDFFEFIKPWCEGEFIGYYRYEKSREPILVYAR